MAWKENFVSAPRKRHIRNHPEKANVESRKKFGFQ
jgi:hypothetical protein